MPRRCVTVSIYDGEVNAPKFITKVRGKFQVYVLVQNGYKGQEHWYSARGAINQVSGKQYINSLDPSQYACGYNGFRKHYLDMGKTSWASGKKILNTEQISALASPASAATKPNKSSPTSVGGSNKSSKVVCGYTLVYSDVQPRWSKNEDVAKYVTEAKDRKLSLEDCDKLR